MLILAGIAIYANTFDNTFIYDDYQYILDNPQAKSLDFGSTFDRVSFTPRAVTFYSFALNYYFGRSEVFGYHLVNLIIHVLSSLLVWRLILLVFATPRMRGDPCHAYRNVIAYFTALMFLSHPIQTESVTYISQRFTSLAGLFYLMSLCFYLQARLRKIPGVIRILLFFASLAAGLLGLYTKQTVATLPLAMLLVELLFFKVPGGTTRTPFSTGGRPIPGYLMEVGKVILFVSICALIPFLYPREFFDSIFSPKLSKSFLGDQITSSRYLLTQFRVILFYLKLLVLPIGQSIDHSFPLSKDLYDHRTLASFIVLAGSIVWGLKLRKRQPLISFGIFWFFITIAVSSSIIPIRHVVFEHRVYLACMGLFLIVSTVLVGPSRNRRKTMATLTIIVLTFSYLTIKRNQVWQNEVTLWTDAMHKAPNKFEPLVTLGVVYTRKNDFHQALKYYNRAVEASHERIYPLKMRADLYSRMGEHELSLKDFEKVLIQFRSALHYRNYADRFWKLGDYESALDNYKRALRNRVVFHRIDIKAIKEFLKKGDIQKSLELLRRVESVDSEIAYTHAHLGKLYVYLNRFDESQRHFRLAALGRSDRGLHLLLQAEQKGFDEVNAYVDLGVRFIYLKDYERAIEDLDKALTIDPYHSHALYSRSYAYWALKNYRRSYDDAVKAALYGYPVEEGYLSRLEKKLLEHEDLGNSN